MLLRRLGTMIHPIKVVVETREDATRWAMECNRRANALIDEGKRALLRVEEAEDERSLKQNAFYWSIVLEDIANQAVVLGERWSKDAWHEYGKREFLPRVITRTVVAGRKNPVVTRKIASTTKLSVRKMAKYLERYMAFAVTDLNVRFRELRWDEYRE